MIKLIDLTYFNHDNVHKPEWVLQKHAPAIGFARYLKNRITLVKHFDHECSINDNNIEFIFFKRSNRFWNIPWKTHRYIRSQKPDVVLVQGLVFPLQTIVLRLSIGAKPKILIQHHGEQPFSGGKKWFQKLACRVCDGFLFTARGNADIWIEKKIIRRDQPCYEVLEASSFFQRRKEERKTNQEPIFLWVGRLD